MKKVKHTPERWKVTTWPREKVVDGFVYVVTDSRGHGVASLELTGCGDNAKAKANAERIAACVNACVGMDNPRREVEQMRHQDKGASLLVAEISRSKEQTATAERKCDELHDKYENLAEEFDALKVERDRLGELVHDIFGDLYSDVIAQPSAAADRRRRHLEDKARTVLNEVFGEGTADADEWARE